MKTLTSIAIVLFLGLRCDCQVAQSGHKSKPAGTITGRITLNGKAIAGARVGARRYSARYSGEKPQLGATTNLQGKFRISNVPPGTYVLLPNLPEFVTSDLSPKERAVVVNEGETVEVTDFALTRGGVITGRVFDGESRPVIAEYVRIIPTDQKLESFLHSLPDQQFFTDDRGVYRVYGLPAGTYKVAIGEEEGLYQATMGKRVYKQTFHRDATDETKARLVEVTSATEVSNIDVEVGRRIDGFGISGQIVEAATGAPLSGVQFGVVQITDRRWTAVVSKAGVSNGSGIFRIDNLPAGRYAVRVTPGKETGYYGETTAFDIVSDDVSGLEIKALRAATLAGVIALEGTDDKAITAILSQLQLQVRVRSEGIGGMGYVTATELSISPDGTFRSGGVPAGTARLILRFPSTDDDRFSILRVERDGIDQSQGFKIKDGEQINGLRVFVGYGTGSLRGAVKLINGAFSPTIYLSAQLKRETESGLVTVKHAQVDARGRFLIERMPAGNYQLLVTLYNPAVSEKPLTVRQGVAISDGIVSEVSVSIDLKSSSTPEP
jgi:hypothetical protein